MGIFKDGDLLVDKQSGGKDFILIYKESEVNMDMCGCYVGLFKTIGHYFNCQNFVWKNECRLATEEEKAQFAELIELLENRLNMKLTKEGVIRL